MLKEAEEVTCEYCVEYNHCEAIQPNEPKFNCTRKKGHKGNHIACGSGHNYAEWENTDDV